MEFGSYIEALSLRFDVFMIHPLLAEFNTWFDTTMYIWGLVFHVYVVLNKHSLSAQANDIYFYVYCLLFDHLTEKLFSIFTLPSFYCILINYFSCLVE